MLKTDPKPALEQDARHRSIYLLPNLFTTAALFAGFFAIVSAMRGDFARAAVAIYIAMIMDGLDGRVARLTNTQSAFGAQYDSLSDMVSFGLAPALVVYHWALSVLGNVGWLAAFIYAATTALRLARFNIQTQNDKRYFIGMPCPSAAAVLAGLVWVSTEHRVLTSSGPFSYVVAGLTVALGLLMVSNIPYHSFKEWDVKGNVPFVALLVIVLAMSIIAFAPEWVLFGAFMVFALSGPIEWCWRWIKHR